MSSPTALTPLRDLLTAAMQRQRLTIHGLAKQLKLPVTNVEKWLLGHASPSPAELAVIAAFLDVGTAAIDTRPVRRSRSSTAPKRSTPPPAATEPTGQRRRRVHVPIQPPPMPLTQPTPVPGRHAPGAARQGSTAAIPVGLTATVAPPSPRLTPAPAALAPAPAMTRSDTVEIAAVHRALVSVSMVEAIDFRAMRLVLEQIARDPLVLQVLQLTPEQRARAADALAAIQHGV